MTIKDELLSLRGDAEVLQAQEVVEWAKSHPESALHSAPEFCGWNVKKSAYEHWLQGARRLIAIHIVSEDGQRQFVSLSIDRSRPGGGYRDKDDVIRDKSLHAIMLADALRDLTRVQNNYDRLSELKPVWKEADKVRRRQVRKAGKPLPRHASPSMARQA